MNFDQWCSHLNKKSLLINTFKQLTIESLQRNPVYANASIENKIILVKCELQEIEQTILKSESSKFGVTSNTHLGVVRSELLKLENELKQSLLEHKK